MRLLIAALLLAGVAVAQPVNPPPAILKGVPPGGAGGPCKLQSTGYLSTLGIIYTCHTGTLVWTVYGGGGGGTPGGSSGQFQYNNGGAFGGVGGYTLPNLATTGVGVTSLPTSGWTIVNGAILNDFATTETDLHIINNASLNVRGIKRAVTVPYTFVAMIECGYADQYLASQTCGIGVTDGTKLQLIEILTQSTGVDVQLRVENWNSVTSDGSTVAGATTGIVGRNLALKIVNDSTHRTYSYWSNGAWVQFFQTTTTNFLTEESVMVSGLSVVAAVNCDLDIRLKYWSLN